MRGNHTTAWARRVATPPRARVATRRGSALVYLTMAMVALLAFASLAVDLGRVQLVRGELQLAADAAARYGAAGLGTGITTAEANAISAAQDNKADGAAVVLTPGTDIEFGTFNDATKTFTPYPIGSEAGADAIRVTARRTAASGNAVPLFFARVVGRTACDVKAQSVARYQPDPAYRGIVGMNGIAMGTNTFVGSYSSGTTTAPTEATATSTGNLYSNGTISAANGSDLKGNVVLGSSAPNPVGFSVTGTTTHTTGPLATPAQAVWIPAANPGGIPQNYTASGNVILPGGAYWFTSLTINGSLTFSGPATLTVNGPVEVNGALRAYNLIPSNLKIFQIGSYTFADSDNNGNNIDLVADISAPSAAFSAKNNLTFRGRMIAGSISVKNNADVYYDTALGGGNAGPKVVTVR